VAEVNLDSLVQQSNERGGMDDADTIAHVEARARIASAWRDQAETRKRFETA
jgi:hypothetical protein